MEEALYVDDLARLVSATPRQLERLFMVHLGMSPSQFDIGLRLGRARELLQQTGMAVNEVAVATGFGSSSYFSHAYRARFGLIPRDDRTEARRKIHQGATSTA